MAEWGDDLVTRLTAQGVGVYGTTIFLSSKAVIPTTGTVMQIHTTGGVEGERTHNSAPGLSAERPWAQLEVKGTTHGAAMTMWRAAFNALSTVTNLTINSTSYRLIRALQSAPIDLGLDPQGRIRYAFNVRGERNT